MKLIYLLIAVFLASCCCSGTYVKIVDSTWVQKIDAEELIRTIIRYTTRMNREQMLTLEDSRVYYTECTERIRLVLSSQKCPEIVDARENLVDFVEGLLNALNNNPSIRADLCHQPFTADDLEIYINFESYFSEYVDPFYVSYISLDDGLVCYYMATIKQWYFDRWHSRIEPYYITRQIANAQKEANVIYPPAVGFPTISAPTQTVIIDAKSISAPGYNPYPNQQGYYNPGQR